MGTRTTLTSSIKVPVYVGWKCSKCGTTTAEMGNMFIQYSATVGSGVSKAKEQLNDSLQKEWKDIALGLMHNPGDHALELRSYLFLQTGKCKGCKHKEMWAKKKGWLTVFVSFCVTAIIIAIFIVISAYKHPVPWIVLIALIGGLVAVIVEEETLKTRIKKVPKHSLPHIMCLNEDLKDYARLKGVELNPPETMALLRDAVEGEDEKATNDNQLVNTQIIQEPVVEQHETELNQQQDSASEKTQDPVELRGETNSSENLVFCHKCGKRLKEASSFCSYCGADLSE